MGLPIDVRDIYRFGREITKDRDEPINITVLVEVDAPEGLLNAVREVVRPRTAQAFVDVEVVEGGVTVLAPGADAVVVLVGSASKPVVDLVGSLRAKGVTVVALTLRDGLGTLDYDLGLPTEDVLTRTDAALLVEEDLAVWLADHVGNKRLALASNFTFTRDAVAMEIVKATALQNALIGVVAIIPGTDMPLMTANQAKMLLQLATAYGQTIGADRLGELATVVGGGFLLRAIARQALVVVPGFGWAVKGGVAYTGTMTMGRAAITWFEQGADMGEVVTHLKEMSRLRETLQVEAVPVEEDGDDPDAGPAQQAWEIGSADEVR